MQREDPKRASGRNFLQPLVAGINGVGAAVADGDRNVLEAVLSFQVTGCPSMPDPV